MHPSVAKTLWNMLRSTNHIALTFQEREYIVQKAGIEGYYLDPQRITKFIVKDTNYKYNIINFRSFHASWLREHHTFGFIHEILGQKKTCCETRLFKRIQAGKRGFSRKIFGEGRAASKRIASQEDVLLYYEYCMNLIESIRAHGFLDKWCGRPDLIERLNLKVRGSPIGLAINKDGKLLHYAKGLHRLAIAQELQLDEVPVAISCISPTYLRRFASRTGFITERTFLTAVGRAANEAIASSLAESPSLPRGPATESLAA